MGGKIPQKDERHLTNIIPSLYPSVTNKNGGAGSVFRNYTSATFLVASTGDVAF
jgi:hypothetical protein